MTEVNFSPFWANAPGNSVKSMASRIGFDDVDLAAIFHWDEKQLRQFFAGEMPIDEDLAEVISSKLGGTSEFWIARENQYRQCIDRIASTEDAENVKCWLRGLPIQDMAANGWIDKYTHWKDKALACLSFFDVDSVEEWEDQYEGYGNVVAFRTSGKFETSAGAVAAWIRQAEIIADHIEIPQWNEKRFWKSLADIRKLTRRKNGAKILAELEEICAACGVALVVLPAPKGCRASGATKKLSGDRRLLLLSLRYKTDDQFWFTFFHEAGHLILHDKEAFHIDGVDLYAGEDVLEHEANDFAEGQICPPSLKPKLKAVPKNYKSILRLASELEISPGLLVGQLQHEGLVSFKSMNFLKSKVIYDAVLNR